jgi:hypothetical protein
MSIPDPEDPQFFSKLRRQAKLFFVAVAALFVLGFVIVAVADSAILGARKEKLPRDAVYYEITNDQGDHGNFIETYHVPDGQGGKVYCIVYSDKIGSNGGGAGISCDWGSRG